MPVLVSFSHDGKFLRDSKGRKELGMVERAIISVLGRWTQENEESKVSPTRWEEGEEN